MTALYGDDDAFRPGPEIRSDANLLERVERRRHFFRGRPLAVIALDLQPANASRSIEHEHRRMRDAVDLFPGIVWITQSITIDCDRPRVRQQREGERPPAIRRDLAREVAALLNRIGTDRQDANVGKCSSEVAESD